MKKSVLLEKAKELLSLDGKNNLDYDYILMTEFEYAKKVIRDNLELLNQLEIVLLEKNHLMENEIEEILSKGKKLNSSLEFKLLSLNI